MTVSLDARTPSASVHALSGSTPPGAGTTMQPFNVATAAVHEMPDTFTPLGVPAADVVAGLAVRRAAAAHPDAEVIDLAGRVKALAERERTLWERRFDVEGQVDDAKPPRPIAPADVQPLFYREAIVDGERTTTIVEPAGWAETLRTANAAYAVAQAEHERHVAEIGVRLGLPRWEKLADRASARLARWGARLATLAPRTQAGLKAKVEASMVCTKGEVYSLSDWRKDLATSISADALRIIVAEAEANVHPDRMVEVHREAAAMMAIADDPAIDAATSDRALDRSNALEQTAITMRPHTVAGAIACLEWALSDHMWFRMTDVPDQGDHLLTALLTGALMVLRGEVAAPADLASAA